MSLDQQETFTQLVNENNELRAELSALKEDALRLDWIAANYLGADLKYDYAGQETIVLLIDIPKGGRVSKDLRSTIDAARRISGGANKEK